MLFSLICYAVQTVICIVVVFSMQVKMLFVVMISVAAVSILICAAFSYNFITKSISLTSAPKGGNDRLSNVIQEMHNGDIENIMIKTIAWYPTILEQTKHFMRLVFSHFNYFQPLIHYILMIRTSRVKMMCDWLTDWICRFCTKTNQS